MNDYDDDFFEEEEIECNCPFGADCPDDGEHSVTGGYLEYDDHIATFVATNNDTPNLKEVTEVADWACYGCTVPSKGLIESDPETWVFFQEEHFWAWADAQED